MSFHSSFLAFVKTHYPFFENSFSEGMFSNRMISPYQITLAPALYQDALQAINALFKLKTNPFFLSKLSSNMPLAAPSSVLMSFDFYCHNNALHLLEINTNASGIFLAFLLEQYHGVKKGIQWEDLHHMFRRAFPGIQKGIAIVDEAPLQQKTYFEQEQFLRFFEYHGYPAFIWDLKDITFERPFFKKGDQQVDCLYNRCCDFYLSATSALKEGYKQNPASINPHPYDYYLFADKLRLTQFCDPLFLDALQIQEEEKKKILSIFPPAKPVSDYDADTLWKERKQLFFKPRHSYGSKGTYKGESLSKKVFDHILSGDYIAQPYIQADSQHGFKYDLRFYVYDGTVLGVVARLFQGQVTNFQTENGGFAPVLMSDALSKSDA